MAKDLKYFMREKEDEIVTVPGPDTFLDEEGKIINLEIKVLSQMEIRNINKNYKKRSMATDKKGNPLVNGDRVIWKEEYDNERATRHLIVEALQYPNLNDPELMKFYKCNDVTDMPWLVFSKADEYQHVLRVVLEALGMAPGLEDSTSQEELSDAKN